MYFCFLHCKTDNVYKNWYSNNEAVKLLELSQAEHTN